MIKIDTINGQLCIMLEKPVPLTKDAKLPCVVRLIQDDSRMGMYNRDTKPNRLSDIYLVAKIVSNSIIVDEFMESDYHRFEILGYPVADGSKEWALYQMMHGNYVIHEGLTPCNIHCGMVTWLDSPESKHFTMQSPDKWLLYCPFNNGWQIYTEPKPLLADAKVGYLVKLRDGRYVQIELVKTDGHPIKANGYYYGYKGILFSGKESPDDIISIEPLEPEGTAEWAWQMMLLGKKVTWGRLTDSYWIIVNGACEYRINDNSQTNTFRRNKSEFLNAHGRTHTWHLYEPDQFRDATKMVESCPTCNGTGKVEKPAPAFKVGDCVEVNANGVKKQGKIMRFCEADFLQDNTNALVLRDVLGRWYGYYRVADITRKLSSHEMVIHIGCLSGTVRSRDNKSFHLLRKGKNTMVIYFDALDTPTRELVQSLLKAQEEK